MSSNPTNPEQVDCQYCHGTGQDRLTYEWMDKADYYGQMRAYAKDRPSTCSHCGGTGKAGARIVMDMYEPIIAREREAAAKEARIAELEWIHGQFLGDQPVIDVVAARHAALTKGEAK